MKKNRDVLTELLERMVELTGMSKMIENVLNYLYRSIYTCL